MRVYMAFVKKISNHPEISDKHIQHLKKPVWGNDGIFLNWFDLELRMSGNKARTWSFFCLFFAYANVLFVSRALDGTNQTSLAAKRDRQEWNSWEMSFVDIQWSNQHSFLFDSGSRLLPGPSSKTTDFPVTSCSAGGPWVHLGPTWALILM